MPRETKLLRGLYAPLRTPLWNIFLGYCLFVVRKCKRRVRQLFRFSSVKQKTKRISSLGNKMYNM